MKKYLVALLVFNGAVSHFVYGVGGKDEDSEIIKECGKGTSQDTISEGKQEVEEQSPEQLLLKAATEGDTDKIELLCKRERSLRHPFGQRPAFRNTQDKKGRTALHLAMKNEHYDAVDSLLRCGVDSRIRDRNGERALFFNFQNIIYRGGLSNFCYEAIRINQVGVNTLDTLKWLIWKGKAIKLFGDWDMRCFLYYAIRNGNEEAAEYLFDRGVLPDKGDERSLVKQVHSLKIFKEMLRMGMIDSSQRSLDGFLAAAVKNNDNERVIYLLEKNAHQDKINEKRETLLHLATDEDVIKTLLAGGANLKARDQLGRTPLHRAAQTGKKANVCILLKNEADPDEQDKFKRTPLHYATEAGHEEATQCLLEHGVNPRAVDEDENTPGMLAQANKRKNVLSVIQDWAQEEMEKDKEEVVCLVCENASDVRVACYGCLYLVCDACHEKLDDSCPNCRRDLE